MAAISTSPQTKRLSCREIVQVQDIQQLFGCSERQAYRHISRAKKEAGRLNAPLTVDQLSIYSGISRCRIKENMR